MGEFGNTKVQFAGIAVACRAHAALNPAVQMRELISVENLLESKMIAQSASISKKWNWYQCMSMRGMLVGSHGLPTLGLLERMGGAIDGRFVEVTGY